jgi:phage baseplate assembly protein W
MAQQLRRYFVGFSTQDSAKTGVRTVYDLDLVNVDLMASFMTRVGERVQRPDWGCRLWDYVMEPLTAVLRDQIIDEVVRIVNLDSRTELQDVQIYELDAGFCIQATLLYLPWRVIDTFSVTFEQDDQIYFQGATA